MTSTKFSEICTLLGIPSTGIHPTASAPNRCLWTCTWRINSESGYHSAADPAMLQPNDLLHLEDATKEQLIAELGDLAAQPAPPAQGNRLQAEAGRLIALGNSDDTSWMEIARNFLRQNREFNMSMRHFLAPWETKPFSKGVQPAGQRPGWA